MDSNINYKQNVNEDVEEGWPIEGKFEGIWRIIHSFCA
jgi:hypothetical protein